MEIDIGAKVISRDGKEVGRVDRLIVHPYSFELYEIVMHKGVIVPRDVVIPFETVRQAESDQIHLNLTADEAKDLPDFVEHLYTQPTSFRTTNTHFILPGLLYPQNLDYFLSPVADVKQMAPGSLELTIGTVVYARDGKIGTVDEVFTDPQTHQVSSFVVHQSGSLAEDRIIPLRLVRHADSRRVLLYISKAQLGQDAGTPQRPDSSSDESKGRGQEDYPMR